MLAFGFVLFREGGHVADDEETGKVVLAVGEDLDALLEASGHLLTAVVGDGDDAAASWRNGVFRIVGDGTATGGMDVVDDKGRLADVAKRKGTGAHAIVLREGAEVVGGLLELDDGILLFLSLGGGWKCKVQGTKQEEIGEVFHNFVFCAAKLRKLIEN